MHPGTECSLRDHELRLCKKDGTVIDCLLTVSVRRGENGRSLAYQGIIRDITERKRAEKRWGMSSAKGCWLDHLRQQLAAFVGSREPHDDVTLLIIQI